MNFFSFGNLLSIIIVLIILIIYRQIDRNNRSLEKVKRFSDKMKDQLAKSVEEKTAEMKNLAIELQVNMKSGKEVLKRVRDVEDGLNERAQGIDDVREKINGYDHALEELVGMTARVEENLKRIQSESLFVDKVGKRINEASEKLKKVEQEIDHVAETFRQDNQKGLQSLRDEVIKDTEQRVRTISASIEASEKKVKDFGVYVTRLESRAEQMQGEVLEGLKESFEQFELDAKTKRSGLLNQYVASLNKLLSEADAKGKSLKKSYTETLSSFDRQLAQAVKRGEALEGKVFENLKALIVKDSEALSAQREGLRKKADEIAAFRQQITNRLNDLLKDSEKMREEGLQKIAVAAERMEVSALESIEDRLEGFEKDIDYKFQRLESANVDIEAMEKSLQASIQKTSENVRAEFSQFTRGFDEERSAERQKVEKEFSQLQSKLAELEEGLTELKSKAYENVSAQLQVFEDEFFKDLTERSASMEQKLQVWQGEIENRMKEVAAAQVEERQRLAQRFNEELKNELEKAKQESFRDLRQIEAKVAAFESSLAERLDGSERDIEGFKSSVNLQLEQSRKAAQSSLGKQIKELQVSMNEAVQKHTHETEERLRAMEGSVNQNKKELQEIIDSTNGEIASWQARVAQALKEYELEFTEKYTSLRQDGDNRIAGIREEFADQSEDLIASTNAERLQLKEEFKDISERIDELETKLVEKSESALDGFKRQVEAFQAELNQRSKDLQVESDNRMRDLRQRLADMKDKTENQQQSLFGKIEEGYQLLTINLNEMDKRVKGFVNQTKIFERADELKIQLEARIEEMKRDTERLQLQRKEVEQLEHQVVSAKKAVDDISGKLKQVLAERSRVEDMDSDFKKLLNISKELDHRIGTVYSSQDTLQEIQAKVRELENLEKITEARFERLEKKSAIIEATTAGVDKNFQSLDQLEKEVKAAGKDLQSFSADLKVLEAQASELSAGREQYEYVIEKIKDLDSVLSELEGRMEKLETAREWLAKTETRFETIGKQAQEQVRLMESILKADKKQSKLGEGAPPMDKRETVTKLAHLGWTPMEIARTTKLSRGEVELILELAPKK
jgi:DNA repair exonuclease SbcCD ATPase subunit